MMGFITNEPVKFGRIERGEEKREER